MVDNSSTHPSNFLTRRHSAGDTGSIPAAKLPVYPASAPDFECTTFMSPEGTYTLAHRIFFRSLTPYYNVGTTASLVSIKYKETGPSTINRYEAQPGARSFRRLMFGHNDSNSNGNNSTNNNNNNNSNNNSTTKIAPSFSSSTSSSHNTNGNHSTTDSKSSQILEEDLYSTVSTAPTFHSSNDINDNNNNNDYTNNNATTNNDNNNNNSNSSNINHPLDDAYHVHKGSTIPLSPGYHDSSLMTPPMNRSQTTASTSFSSSLQGKQLYSPSISTSLSSSMTYNNGPSSPRKPKSNITKTNSSFVQRIVTNDQLAKILVARTSDDTNLFYNCGSNFVWMDASCQPMEPLSRIIFARAYPTSHDVNLLTRGSDHLDIIIGFTSGDIVWFDPLCNKYGRINKGGIMNSSSITMIRWLQGSESLLMAAFQDGSVMIFDKEKEDDAFQPDDNLDGPISSANEINASSSPTSHWHFHQKYVPSDQSSNFEKSSSSRARAPKQTFRVSKSSSKVSAKCNPVSHWKLSNQSITAFAFSPDCQHVAVVGLDGYLRVINYVHEKLYDVYEAYYGGLLCVAWSPDGKYILAGGQDDLVTIWAFREQRLVARCQGHSSWVTSVAFDPWRCDERVYRFASVGEDAKLILWDFSVPALHRPKTKVNTRHRGASVSSTNNSNHLIQTAHDRPVTLHPVTSKTEVAFLQPTVVKTVHADPCVGVYYREDVIVTTDKRGRVCLWKRPQ